MFVPAPGKSACAGPVAQASGAVLASTPRHPSRPTGGLSTCPTTPDHHRQPDRPDLRAAHPGRDDQGHRPAQDQDRRRGLRAHDVRPGLHQHRLLPEPHHVHRRDQGILKLPRLSHRAAGRAQHVPGHRLPGAERRAAHAHPARRVGLQHHAPHDGAREHQGAAGRLPLRRAPHGHADVDGGGPQHVLPGSQERARQADAPRPDLPADREGADAGRLLLSPPDGPALRLPEQRPSATAGTSCR